MDNPTLKSITSRETDPSMGQKFTFKGFKGRKVEGQHKRTQAVSYD